MTSGELGRLFILIEGGYREVLSRQIASSRICLLRYARRTALNRGKTTTRGIFVSRRPKTRVPLQIEGR